MNLFEPAMAFLPNAMENMSNFEKVTFYTEEMVLYVLDLLSQSLDGNKTNQDFLLNNFKIFDSLTMLINQNEYLDVAGKGCLVLSNLLFSNTSSKKLFSSA